eukprot:Skav232458  [mRNA]  locus=scaffold75:75957:77452:- [translate_table: standard]
MDGSPGSTRGSSGSPATKAPGPRLGTQPGGRLKGGRSPVYLSYSGVKDPSDATRVSIRPPPGLEQLKDGKSPLFLPLPPALEPNVPELQGIGVQGAVRFPPPDFDAPSLEKLEATPPAPQESPCVRLALLQQLPQLPQHLPQYMPHTPGVVSTGHDASSCRPCAFYHTKGCTLANL